MILFGQRESATVGETTKIDSKAIVERMIELGRDPEK